MIPILKDELQEDVIEELKLNYARK